MEEVEWEGIAYLHAYGGMRAERLYGICSTETDTSGHGMGNEGSEGDLEGRKIILMQLYISGAAGSRPSLVPSSDVFLLSCACGWTVSGWSSGRALDDCLDLECE